MQTADQRMESLNLANERRSAMRVVKVGLSRMPYSQARCEAARLLSEGSEVVDSMRLRQFLTSLPKVGTQKSSVILRQLGVRNGDMRVGELTGRQRALLGEVLRAVS